MSPQRRKKHKAKKAAARRTVVKRLARAPQTREDDEADPDRPDFGGLPARDLKKNLGCG